MSSSLAHLTPVLWLEFESLFEEINCEFISAPLLWTPYTVGVLISSSFLQGQSTSFFLIFPSSPRSLTRLLSCYTTIPWSPLSGQATGRTRGSKRGTNCLPSQILFIYRLCPPNHRTGTPTAAIMASLTPYTQR